MQWPNDATLMAQAILTGDTQHWGAQHIHSKGIDARLQIHTRHMWHTLTSALKTNFPNFAECPNAINWWHKFIAATPVCRISELPSDFLGWLNEQDISNAWLARAQFDAAMQRALHQPCHRSLHNNAPPLPSDIAIVPIVRRAALVELLHCPKSNWQAERCYMALLREGNRVAQYYLSSHDFMLLSLLPCQLGSEGGSTLLDALSEVLDKYPSYPVVERVPMFWQANLIGVQS